jgi:hypothetical protein
MKENLKAVLACVASVTFGSSCPADRPSPSSRVCAVEDCGPPREQRPSQAECRALFEDDLGDPRTVPVSPEVLDAEMKVCAASGRAIFNCRAEVRANCAIGLPFRRSCVDFYMGLCTTAARWTTADRVGVIGTLLEEVRAGRLTVRPHGVVRVPPTLLGLALRIDVGLLTNWRGRAWLWTTGGYGPSLDGGPPGGLCSERSLSDVIQHEFVGYRRVSGELPSGPHMVLPVFGAFPWQVRDLDRRRQMLLWEVVERVDTNCARVLLRGVVEPAGDVSDDPRRHVVQDGDARRERGPSTDPNPGRLR